MIERTCQQCGKHFLILPSCLKRGQGKFCSNKCRGLSMVGKPLSQEIRNKISKGNLGKHLSEEHKQKLSRANQGKTQTDETKHRKSEVLKGRPAWNKGKHHTEESKRKISLAQLGNHRGKGRHMPLEVRQKLSKIMQFKYQDSSERLKDSRAVKMAYENDPKLRIRQSLSHKALWQDESYKEKQVQILHLAAHKRPTKPEKKMIDILKSNLPQYKYNGNYGLGITLAGLIPDFVNTNGKKEVIEIFGDYWHNNDSLKWHQTELGRTMAYNSVGYKCLVIWEREVKSLDSKEIVSKIKGFFSTRGK